MRITPRELGERLEGQAWRDEREMFRLAWLAATLINHGGQVKSPVSPVELLGLRDKYRLDGSPRSTAEQIEQEKRDLIKRLEGD